ncbi:MAG: carboxypeptidase M32 [Vicinamibacterales bacterium]
MTDHRFAELKSRLAEIHDISKAGALLGWDQQVMMPRGGAAVRAEQLATLGRLAHERFVDPAIGHLLDSLEGFEASRPYDSDEASLIRVTRSDYHKARRVPADLRAEMARVAALARDAWGDARAACDFAAFVPHLRRTIDVKLRYVDCFDEFETAYDALLDDYERGTTASDASRLFEAMKTAVVPLLAAIAERADHVSDACLHGSFPVDVQRRFCEAIVEAVGFEDQQWRLDPTTHPFASSTCTRDIRITTRYYPDHLSPAVFGTFHECGHGLYENGVSPSLERTPLCRGASLGLHESQSRLWENLVGRSRAAWRYFLPRLRQHFPGAFDTVDVETFYRAINKVQPTLIRVEADELTYGLHIVLRFELEQELLAGTISLEELPEAWNARMKAYLGVEVPDAASGVLQDVHWSLGLMGYFPTYTIGSIVSAQIWERIRADIPDLEAQFGRGEFLPLRTWLTELMHRHGRKFTPRETLARVVGADRIDVAPYVGYLRSKFAEIYDLD